MKIASIPESDIIGQLQSSKVRAVVVILDACRDNAFALAGQKSLGSERGFAPVNHQAEGIFAIYSAGFGQSALDNLGPTDKSCNSVFTRALVAALYRSDKTHLAELVIKLREEVANAAATVNHLQNPAYYDETKGGLLFLAAGPPRSGPPPNDGTCVQRASASP
jgi:hypothetical protein